MKDLRFQQLFIEQLRDFYWAENHIASSLPKMIDAATSYELKSVLNNHLDVTKNQANRLEKILENLGENTDGQAGPAVKGLVQEGRKIIADTRHDGAVQDAALIIAARKIEHYEIATFDSLITLANQMDDINAVQLLNGNNDTLSAETAD